MTREEKDKRKTRKKDRCVNPKFLQLLHNYAEISCLVVSQSPAKKERYAYFTFCI
jgi:hypothetical protein